MSDDIEIAAADLNVAIAVTVAIIVAIVAIGFLVLRFF